MLLFKLIIWRTVTNLKVSQISSQICSQYTSSLIGIPERRDHFSGLSGYPRKNIKNINKQTIFRIVSGCMLLMSSQKEMKPLRAVFPNACRMLYGRTFRLCEENMLGLDSGGKIILSQNRTPSPIHLSVFPFQIMSILNITRPVKELQL